MDWFDKILSTGLGVTQALKQTDAAKYEANAAKANAAATTAQTNATTRWLMIGGGVLVLVVILAMVFRRK